MNDIIQNNRLIAEFMDEFKASKSFNTHNSHCMSMSTIKASDVFEFEKEGYNVSTDYYHMMWGDLMPVIKRIQEIELNHAGLGYHQGKVLTIPIYANIEEVYKAVVIFINWYNQQTIN